MKNFKKYSFMFLVLLFTFVFSCSSVFAFSDVGRDHWAYTAVKAMEELGIINGYADGTFKPENNVTRAEFAKFVVLTLGLTEKEVNIEYEDIEEASWAKEYLDIGGKYFTAYKQGDKYFFKPNEASLREDVIVTTVLALGMEKNDYDLDILNQFSDRETITPSLEKYIAIAVENDLIHGNENGTLNPQGNLTRAEVSQFMYNILVRLGRIVEKEEEIIKVPIFDELEEEMTVEFYSIVNPVERIVNGEYVLELQDKDRHHEYVFSDRTEGKELWETDDDLVGSFTVVTLNEDNEIEGLEDLDNQKFMINYGDIGKDISLRLKIDEDKYIDVKSMNNVKYDKENKILVDLEGNSINVKSSVVVVKLSMDDKRTEKKSDDEFKSEFIVGHEELENVKDDYVVVVLNSASTAKYVIVFEKNEEELL